MQEIFESLLGLLLLITAIFGLRNFTLAMQRVRQGEAMVQRSARREVPWGFMDLMLVLLLLAGGAVLIGACLWLAFPDVLKAPRVELSPEVRATFELMSAGIIDLPEETTLPPEVIIALTAADSLLKLAVILAMVAIVNLRVGATPRDWGWDSQHLWEDIFTGIQAFTILIPVVFLVQGTLIYLFDWPSQHPLVESLKQAPSWALFSVSFFAAVIMAPLAEEWAFRVLLQGWLEKWGSRRYGGEQLLMGGDQPIPLEEPTQKDAPARPRYLSNMGGVVWESVSPIEPSATRPWWPVVFSAALFALVHFSHGPDFVPLFFLALGLGYLYRQTHRITPSLVVHFLLNLFSMTSIGVELWLGK